MRLAVFLEQQADQILQEAVSFARSLEPLENLDETALKDHFSEILVTITADLRHAQGRTEAIEKSKGNGPDSKKETAAESHGLVRADSGLSVSQLFAEYRALRSSVLRLWVDQHPLADDSEKDLTRFNEAIDQAIQESVTAYEKEVEKLRNVFLGVLGHDLRGPLHAITLLASLLEVEVQEPLNQTATRLVKSVKRMNALLDSLLEMNRGSLGVGMTLDRNATDIGSQCRAEIEILQSAYPDTHLETAMEGNLRGSFDGSRVREALSNLVTNAVKHSSNKKEVFIEVRGDEKAIEIVIENAGAISASDTRKIFEPLGRGTGADQSKERTNLGLGLFITRQIARAHGGDVELHCEAGRVRFTLVLPKTESQPAARSQPGRG